MHGLVQSADLWEEEDYVEKLAAHYQLILIDARGHGRSHKPAKPEDYTIEKLAEDVALVLDALNIKKIPVFRLLKCGGKVYTKVILDASSSTLTPAIEYKVTLDSIVYSDSWHGYNALDVSASNICALTIPGCLLKEGITSMESRISGIRQRDICVNLTVFPRPILGYI